MLVVTILFLDFVMINLGKTLIDRLLKHEFGSIQRYCLSYDGTVVVLWSLTQEVTGLSRLNDKYFCHRIQQIQGKR